jgi:hypothetical protein
MRRTGSSHSRQSDLARVLLKLLKQVTKEKTKRMLIIVFFLGKDRYLAAKQPKIESGENFSG